MTLSWILFAYLGVLPLLYQILNIFAGGTQVLRALETINPVLKMAAFKTNWGMFTSFKKSGFRSYGHYQIEILEGGRQVSLLDFSRDVRLNRGMSAVDFSDEAATQDFISYACRHLIPAEISFNGLRLIYVGQDHSQPPGRLWAKFECEPSTSSRTEILACEF